MIKIIYCIDPLGKIVAGQLNIDDGATLGFWCLVWEHLDMWHGDIGNWTTDPKVHGQLLYQWPTVLVNWNECLKLWNCVYKCVFLLTVMTFPAVRQYNKTLIII